MEIQAVAAEAGKDSHDTVKGLTFEVYVPGDSIRDLLYPSWRSLNL